MTISAGVTTVTGPEGTDTLVNVELLKFSDGLYGPDGAPASRIDGTSGADSLQGTMEPDQMWGGAGNDSLSGGVGDDWLYGQGGDDVLNGQAGVDVMNGGAGNDTFFVNNSSDGVVEAAGGGTDTIRAQSSYFLAAGVEVEVLRAASGGSTTALNLFGNEFANQVLGSAGVNVLRGEGGDDDLRGFAGDDTLRGGTGNDALDGGDGTDTAQFAGARSGYTITTVAGVTTITGADGTDTLRNVERLQFGDGVYDLNGDPLAAPQTLPGLEAEAGGKHDLLMDDPFVLPLFDGDLPPVMPPVDDGIGFKALTGGDQPDIMPGVETDGLPLLLPAEGASFKHTGSLLWLDEGLTERPTHQDDVLA